MFGKLSNRFLNKPRVKRRNHNKYENMSLNDNGSMKNYGMHLSSA